MIFLLKPNQSFLHLKNYICPVLLKEYQEINATAMDSYLFWFCFCVCFRARGPGQSLERRNLHSLPREQHTGHRCSGVQASRRKIPPYFCCNSNIVWKPGPACKDPPSCRRLAFKASWCCVSDSSAAFISCLAPLLPLRVSSRPGETDAAGVDPSLVGTQVPDFLPSLLRTIIA